ncbi:MAG: penicillin-binding protein [Candidatus Schekmanbacteria bacterium]|nr:MAG: penicillin-binding protein [Candidatus Schekmanbacteria bacterium]
MKLKKIKKNTIDISGTNVGLNGIRRRIKTVFALICLVFLTVVIRDFYLQTIKNEFLAEQASRQYRREIEIKARRGKIFDRNYYSLAVSVDCDSVFAVPSKVADIESTADILSRLLSLDKESVIKKLSQKREFVWIKRKISEEESVRLRRRNLRGIGFIKESKRFYPQECLASQLLGFTGVDNEGLEGVEREFDEYIAGKSGIKVITEKDAKGGSPFIYEKPVTDGDNVVLTIDKNIQFIVQSELEKGVKFAEAKSGMAIVVDPANGDILAMANYPGFNPNKRNNYSPSTWRNRIVTDCFEPGSVFKIVFACAAIEKGIVMPDSEIDCSPGFIVVGGRKIRDSHPHNMLTFTEVLEKSSNVGSIKIAQLLGENELYKYIRKFGFGEKTGIQLQGEARGILRKPKDWSLVSIGAITIGQEIAVTPLQLAMAYSAIANGGLLLKPRIAKRIESWDGEIKKVFPPVTVRRVISERTAHILRGILKTVVSEEGTAHLARIEGFEVAGKTGTAQKAENGAYQPGKYYSSFIGIVPADAPRFVIAVILDEPKKNHYGGIVSAPIFREIAKRSLLYCGVKPHKEDGKLRLVVADAVNKKEERNL